MINLMPTSTKERLKAAHSNVMLISNILVLFIATLFLTAICFVSYLILSESKDTAQTNFNNNSLVSNNYSIKSKITAMNNTFTLATNILDKQINYSDILIELGSRMPANVVIDSLTVSGNTIGTPITVKARAKTASDVTNISAAFSGSSILSNVSFGNATTNQSDATGYPYEFVLNITVNRIAY